MMYLEMAKYTLILLAMIAMAGLVLYALVKRFGLPGIAKGILGGMGVVGKGLLIFFAAGAEADKEDADEPLMGPFIFDAEAHGVGTGHKDSKGNLYL